jgi:hypothetical protein
MFRLKAIESRSGFRYGGVSRLGAQGVGAGRPPEAGSELSKKLKE